MVCVCVGGGGRRFVCVHPHALLGWVWGGNHSEGYNMLAAMATIP